MPMAKTANNVITARAVDQLVQPDRKLNLEGGHVATAPPTAPPDWIREPEPRERECERGILYRYNEINSNIR
jgi:hypothetical protein